MGDPRFREVQTITRPRLPLGIALLVTVSVGWSLGESDPAVPIAGGLFVLVVAVSAAVRLTVAVDDGRLRLRLFPGLPRAREVPLATVEEVEVLPADREGESATTWRSWLLPLGLARGRGGRVYDLTGTGQVQLRRADGTVLVVGSRRPRELAAAVEAAGDRSVTPRPSGARGGSPRRRRQPR